MLSCQFKIQQQLMNSRCLCTILNLLHNEGLHHYGMSKLGLIEMEIEMEMEIILWQKLKVRMEFIFEIELEIGMDIVWQEWN